mmetsp:Transcript_2012/g.2871  ORF Transcript_2012/g.2871 Transcript_2012/m.2871 type:complete len:1015 (+) Transcript_2012:175-3219(+)
MFPSGASPCLREGKVLFSGQDVKSIVDIALKMQKEGKTQDPQYKILLSIVKQMVRQAEEREARFKQFHNVARLQEASAGVFSRDQYEMLSNQVTTLSNFLMKNQAVSAQLQPRASSMKQPPPNDDFCAVMTELVAVQMLPCPVHESFLLAEKQSRMDDQVKTRRKLLDSSIEQLEAQSKPVPIELRLAQIRLSKDIIECQDRLRKEVVASLDRSDILMNEFRIPQIVESQQRQREKVNRRNRLKENKRKERARREFLNAVCSTHRRIFNAHHRDQKRLAKNLAKAVVKEFQNRKRKEDEQERARNKARLEALRDKDEKKYMELLMEAKNERLMSLLKQTEEYMEKIGATIQKEQERNQQLRHPDMETNDMNEENGSADESTPGQINIISTRKRYYNIAHKYKEIVKQQPKALVFGTLRNYQMAGLQWLVSLYNNNLNGILADEMGLGKTVQSISLLAYVMEKKNNNGPFLVIAPMSTLRNNWAMELARWVPSMVFIVYDGNKEGRKKLREEDMASGNYNVLLTTFEFAMRDKKYLRKVHWQYIIVDEAHRLKNPKCKLVSDLNEYNKGARRIALSGTPLQNDLPELWSLLNFLHPSIFNSCDNFQQWFSAPLEKNLGAEDNNNVDMNEEEKLLVIDRLHSILRPFVLRREKNKVLGNLKDKVDVVLRCRMSPVQKALYEAIRDNKVQMHNRMVQLRKVCNHPYLFHPSSRGNSYRYLIDDDLVKLCTKFRLLDKILPKLKAKNHRVLLFNQMTKTMNIIGHFLDYRKYRYLRLDGTTNAAVRAQNLKLFNAKDSPFFVFMLSTKAGGLGLNLQSADTVILFDSDWNPQNDRQAQARAHRIGQKAKVISIRFVTVDTIEEKVLQTANNKRDIEAIVIQAGEFNKKHKRDESSKMLKDLLRNRQDAEIDKISGADFINRSIARSEEEYHFYKKMDEKDDYKPPEGDKYPLWVWDFLINGSKATETSQRYVTRQEAYQLITKLVCNNMFADPTLIGKRKRNSSKSKGPQLKKTKVVS